MIQYICNLCKVPVERCAEVGDDAVRRGKLLFRFLTKVVAEDLERGQQMDPKDLHLCQSCVESVAVEAFTRSLRKRWVRKDSLDNGAPPGVDSGATKGPHESDPPLPISPPVP